MRKYTALCAQDVPHYGYLDVEAETAEEALAKVKEQIGEVLLEVEWDNAHSYRIVHLDDITEEDPGPTIFEDVPVDDIQAHLLTPTRAQLLDAAPEMREILALLVEWSAGMGDWENSAWDRARKLLERLRQAEAVAYQMPAEPARVPAETHEAPTAVC